MDSGGKKNPPPDKFREELKKRMKDRKFAARIRHRHQMAVAAARMERLDLNGMFIILFFSSSLEYFKFLSLHFWE